ncbi:MAG: class I SAM-dependent methyltransferase [Actinomycetota bacterium]
MATGTYDEQADAMAERVFEATLGMMDTLVLHIGDQLGYYRSLADDGPATSAELASRTGTQERYAREWLEHQTIAGIVEVDDVAAAAGDRRYTLPPAHAEVLCDRTSLRYSASLPLEIAAVGLQVPALLDAYRDGGGISWDRYGDLIREGQADTNRPLFMESMPSMLESVEDIGNILRRGGRVADIGCGFGWSSIGLAAAFDGVTVDGFDLDTPSVEAARRYAAEAGVADRVRFHDVDAGDGGIDGDYDLAIACECVHDMPDPVSALATMNRLTAPDGTVVVMDERVAEEFGNIGDPLERMMYGFSTLVCLPDGLSTPGSVGTGTVMRPSVLRGYAKQAGFRDVEILPIEHDVFRFYRLVA